MLLPIRQPSGLVCHTLICDNCRQPIHEADFRSATADFSPITAEEVADAAYDKLVHHATVRHFHAACAGARCSASHWAKVDRVMYSLAANVFDAEGSTIGEAAMAIRQRQLPTETPTLW